MGAHSGAAVGEDPDPGSDPRFPTLSQAIDLHLRAMRARACTDRSLQTLREETARHLLDWFERPLASLRRRELAERHEHLTAAAGPYLANRVLHQLRAVYNTAARRCEQLPATNPVIAVTFNRVRRRRQPIPWPELPAWRRKVAALRNPIRRDLQLVLLLTGLRSLDARTIRWEHLDLAAGTLHRPSPKGGPDRAFTIPLATPLLALLTRRRQANPHDFGDDAGWSFPTRTRAGHTTHVIEPKQQRLIAGKKRPHLPSPHRLRDTFATAAHESGVHPLDLKVLMNHALPAPDDVTLGYIRPSVEHLRASAERIAAFLLERMGESGLTPGGSQGPP